MSRVLTRLVEAQEDLTWLDPRDPRYARVLARVRILRRGFLDLQAHQARAFSPLEPPKDPRP